MSNVNGSDLLIFEFAWHNFFGAGNLRAKIKRRIRRRTDEIGQLTGTFVDGQTKLVNSMANSLTDRQ